MRKAIVLTLIITSLGLTAQAQNYSFKVLASKGSNTYNSGEGWQPLKQGLQLQQGDSLKTNNDSYIGLLHGSSGQTLELKEQGNFSVKQLEGKLTSSSTGIMSKYAKYLINKMSEEEGAPDHRLAATGAVTRGEEDVIKVFVPYSVEVFSKEAYIIWDGGTDNDEYEVVLKNMFDEVIETVSVKDKKYKINFEDPDLAAERLIIVSVKSKTNDEIRAQDFGIKKLSPKERAMIEEEYKELISYISKNNALDQIILASFYEENNLLIDALTSYVNAMDLAPEIKDFEELYNDFLARNGLK